MTKVLRNESAVELIPLRNDDDHDDVAVAWEQKRETFQSIEGATSSTSYSSPSLIAIISSRSISTRDTEADNVFLARRFLYLSHLLHNFPKLRGSFVWPSFWLLARIINH
jgi:hypothetical protein